MKPNRPSVSRDTRLLLVIVLVSMGMLWVLARIRFPDRLPTPNPAPAVLAQLAPPSPLDDIAASVAELEPRLDPLLLAINVSPSSGGPDAHAMTIAALRFRDDLAVALVRGSDATRASDLRAAGAAEIARDPASQLTVMRVPVGSTPAFSTWTPRRLPSPRFLIAADASRNGAVLRPLFVGSLQPTASPTWSGSIWMVPPPAAIAAGTFVFTLDGALAGLAVDRDGQRALVPADTVLAMADRLARNGQTRRGNLGIDVQPLTPALASATGATIGVLVTWVDPHGPAAGLVGVADVIERIGDEPLTTQESWRAHVARLTADEPIVLGVRRQGALREVHVTASTFAASLAAADDRSPGLALRTLPGIGASVTRVEAGSPAARAGLEAGDVITLVGSAEAPTAAQAAHALAAAPRNRPIVVGVTRAGAHYVLALERTW